MFSSASDRNDIWGATTYHSLDSVGIRFVGSRRIIFGSSRGHPEDPLQGIWCIDNLESMPSQASPKIWFMKKNMGHDAYLCEGLFCRCGACSKWDESSLIQQLKTYSRILTAPMGMHLV